MNLNEFWHFADVIISILHLPIVIIISFLQKPGVHNCRRHLVSMEPLAPVFIKWFHQVQFRCTLGTHIKYSLVEVLCHGKLFKTCDASLDFLSSISHSRLRKWVYLCVTLLATCHPHVLYQFLSNLIAASLESFQWLHYYQYVWCGNSMTTVFDTLCYKQALS